MTQRTLPELQQFAGHAPGCVLAALHATARVRARSPRVLPRARRSLKMSGLWITSFKPAAAVTREHGTEHVSNAGIRGDVCRARAVPPARLGDHPHLVVVARPFGCGRADHPDDRTTLHGQLPSHRRSFPANAPGEIGIGAGALQHVPPSETPRHSGTSQRESRRRCCREGHHPRFGCGARGHRGPRMDGARGGPPRRRVSTSSGDPRRRWRPAAILSFAPLCEERRAPPPLPPPRPEGLKGLDERGHRAARCIAQGRAGHGVRAGTDKRHYVIRVGDRLGDGVIEAMVADAVVIPDRRRRNRRDADAGPQVATRSPGGEIACGLACCPCC